MNVFSDLLQCIIDSFKKYFSLLRSANILIDLRKIRKSFLILSKSNDFFFVCLSIWLNYSIKSQLFGRNLQTLRNKYPLSDFLN